ncbi:hypothetical protein V6N12_041511, partial [Hibiscus sabdariffa]
NGPGAELGDNPGVGAGASAAMTALMEAAATMTAHEIFFMSMVLKNKLIERPAATQKQTNKT